MQLGHNADIVLEESRDLLMTKCWKDKLKGLFEVRTLLKFIFEYLLQNYRKVAGRELMDRSP